MVKYSNALKNAVTALLLQRPTVNNFTLYKLSYWSVESLGVS